MLFGQKSKKPLRVQATKKRPEGRFLLKHHMHHFLPLPSSL
jgi:hypothetical protein